MSRPYPWEKSYPPSISWDTPIETLTLPAMLDRSVARNAARHAISFRERRITYRELADAADAFAAGLL
ncbi:MAG: dicarboxylate--CoA ligase PimA, partial [Pseudorhodoplanes sp.]|nr:dicarboxylate--CoA ligase PimA [Pseudorhodoplanes sp.]